MVSTGDAGSVLFLLEQEQNTMIVITIMSKNRFISAKLENNYELLGIYYELFITFAKNKSDYESISNNITLFVVNGFVWKKEGVAHDNCP